MLLELKRRWLTAESTVGELYVDGVFECFTLEACYRGGPKIPGQTCIPVGRYPVRITHSPKFRIDLPLLFDVPGFDGVRIHSGIPAEDTEGCILLGQAREPNRINASRTAYDLLFTKLKAADEITLAVSVMLRAAA